MIIRELIELLAAYDPETRVLVSGYECGYDDPIVFATEVALNVNESDVLGAHEPYEDAYHGNRVAAVIVGRPGR